MVLDAWRWCLMTLVLVALSLGWVGAQAWWSHLQTARASADSALAFIEARLAEIDEPMHRLQGSDELQAAVLDCSSALTARLLHESLSSLLIQRLLVRDAAGARACGPAGALAAPDLPIDPGADLALVSQRSIATQLMAVRRIDAQHSAVALLDPRALALPTQGPWANAAGMADRISLQSADGRTLRVWGQQGPAGERVESLHVVRHSAQHRIAVSVELERDRFVADLLQRVPLAMLLAVVTSLLLAAAVWRRTMLRARLVYRLERALRKRQFEPFVQPIVDLASGRCIGGEVLMRWAHPQRGILPPGDFIEVAERTGLIAGMSELVMGRAAHRLAPLAQAHPDLYFSFNVTPEQLVAPAFGQRLAEIFSPETLPRGQVLLELTERDFVDPVAKSALTGLHDIGWRIAIDDFGTGQSSLAMLESLPIDRIKIDRSFVSTIGEQTASRPVLDAIIGLAHQLGIRLIAEGVETTAQWDYLASRGVSSAQGYLIAKPLPLDTFVRWFGEQGATAAAAGETSARRPSAPGDPVLQALWQRMRSTGGLDIHDRMHRLRSYRRCFVGREAVDWLVRHQRVSREEAVRIGRRLVALGWARHVVDEHDFEDADLFFSVADSELGPVIAPPVQALRQALRSVDAGPAFADHRRGLLLHRGCSTGRQIVDWLVQGHAVSRDEAAQWAVQLMRQGALRHVYDDRPFADDGHLYRST